MTRYIIVILSFCFLSACEDANVLVMTDAAKDAITAITLSDEDVSNLAQRAIQVSDSKHRVAPKGNPYDTRLQRVLANFSKTNKSVFNFKVYLTKDVNAFAMADGTIRVNSGLMDLMNDEEFLFVIGHEMGHVVKKHSRKQVVLTYASSALRKALASQNNEVGQIARSVVGAFAQQLTSAQFSQHEERQADQYGVEVLKFEGYDTNAAISALTKLAVLAKQHTFLSSHPDPETRAKVLLLAGDSDSEEQGSILTRLFKYGEAIVVGLLELLRSLVNWALSYW